MTGSVRKRKNLTAEKKYAIVEEVKRNSSTKSEILRREGLYSTVGGHFKTGHIWALQNQPLYENNLGLLLLS